MNVESPKKSQKDYTTSIALVSSNIKDCTISFIPLKRDIRLQRYDFFLFLKRKTSNFIPIAPVAGKGATGAISISMNCLPYGVGKNEGDDHQDSNNRDYNLEHTLNHLTTLHSFQAFTLETAGSILMMMMVMVVMLLFLLFSHYFLDIV